MDRTESHKCEILVNVGNDIFVQVIAVVSILIELYAKKATHNQPYTAKDSACSYFCEIKELD